MPLEIDRSESPSSRRSRLAARAQHIQGLKQGNTTTMRSTTPPPPPPPPAATTAASETAGNVTPQRTFGSGGRLEIESSVPSTPETPAPALLSESTATSEDSGSPRRAPSPPHEGRGSSSASASAGNQNVSSRTGTGKSTSAEEEGSSLASSSQQLSKSMSGNYGDDDGDDEDDDDSTTARGSSAASGSDCGESWSRSIEAVSSETTEPTSPGGFRRDKLHYEELPHSPIRSRPFDEESLDGIRGGTMDGGFGPANLTSPTSPTIIEPVPSSPTKATATEYAAAAARKLADSPIKACLPSGAGIEEEAVLPPRSSSPPTAPLSPLGGGPSLNSPRSDASSPHGRVPGGAAAKLMLLGPSRGSSEEDDMAELAQKASQESMASLRTEANLKEIELTMKKAKVEFERGSETNRRYQPTPIPEDVEGQLEKSTVASEGASATTPSFMNRNEIFHETAQAAVQALLTPRDSSNAGDGVSSANTGSGDLHPAFSGQQSQVSSVSAFQMPKSESTLGMHSTVENFESLARRDISHILIGPETERKLEAMKERMHDPSKTLADLLTAIASPDDKSEVNLGYMVRRKNACGALQVLTTEKKNRVKICWTVGVLPALTSVLTDAGSGCGGVEVAFPDGRIRAEYEAARNRAIAALVNLSVPVENRIPVFHAPELAQALISVIREDDGVARRGCASVLAYLAKSVENRLLMVQVPGFMAAIVKVLEPELASVETPPPPKKQYNWSTTESESVESGHDELEREEEEEEEEEEEDDDEEEEEEEEEGQETRIDSFGSNATSGKSLQTSQTDDLSEKISKTASSPLPGDMSDYDEKAHELLRGARQNVFAIATHLVKEKDNAYHFARDTSLVTTLVAISRYQESTSHVLAVKLLANLTRHRLNTKVLVFRHRIVVPALVQATLSGDGETRQYACYALQNLAQDKSCRQELAITDNLITALCDCARQTTAEEERLAAISALKNLCDEPANLIPMTNTPECIATLMHLAHGREAGVTEIMQYRACDALATLSHWLRKIATSGQALDSTAKRTSSSSKGLFVPSLRVVTWHQWN